MQEIVVVLLAGLVAGIVCGHWKTSVLVGYLLAGVLIGKGLFGWVSDANHEIEYLAEAGVFLLLFSIGLEFSLDELARLGRHLFVGGGVQMLLVALPTTLAAHAVGMTWQAAIVTALAVSFSSTVLVFKSLSELGHAVTPHGRRAIGILLFQDAALVPLLLLVPLLTGQDEAAGARDYVLLGLTSAFFVASVLLARLALRSAILPLVTRYRSVELLVLLTVVVLSGTTLAAHSLGLPPAVGAFSAGLMFSDNRRSAQIDALILPFREVFAAVFFVSLGSLLDPALLVLNQVRT